MRFSVLLSAFFGAMALGLPTTAPRGDDDSIQFASTATTWPPQTEYAATVLFKQQNRKYTAIFQDYQGFVAMPNCLDLKLVFGTWDNAARSIDVRPGYQCNFYTDDGCKGKVLTLGEKGKCVEKNTLDRDFDKAINSIFCSKT